MRCDHYNTRVTDDNSFAFRGHRFCTGCTSAVTSWFLDGGIEAAPDLFGDLLTEEEEKRGI